MNENRKPLHAAGEISVWSVARLLLGQLHWLLLAGLACGLAVWLGVTLLVSPTYQSRVSFYVYNTAESTAGAGTINNSDLQAAEALATTYSKILESNSVLDAVLEHMRGTGDLSRRELSEMIRISVVDDTQLLEVLVESPDPQLSCDIAASFSEAVPTEIVRITKAGGVEVVDRPEVAEEKSSPRTLFDTAVGVIVGLVVAAVLLVLRAYADTTLYLPEDIESMVGAVVLGQIPEISPAEGPYAYWKLQKGGSPAHEAKKAAAPSRK